MKNQKGFVIPLVIAIVAVLAIGGGVYSYKKSEKKTGGIRATTTATSTTTVATSTGIKATSSMAAAISIKSPITLNSNKEYNIPACGMKLTVKNGQTAVLSTSTDQYTLKVGDGIAFDCTKTYIWAQFNVTIDQVLGVDGSGKAPAVDKNAYLVFDQSTRANISALYSEKPAPHTAGSELIGFVKGEWYYRFYFAKPEQAKSQTDFVVSVK